jgi:carbohydrate-selective porin OprB
LSIKYEHDFNDKYSFRSAVAQGVGGNQLSNPHATKYVETLKDGGAFFITEFSRGNYIDDELKSELKIGAWLHTGSKSLRFKNYTSSDTIKNHIDYGAYLIFDKLIFNEKNDNSQGLYSFVDLGFAPGDYNIFNYYTGLGLSYKGIFPKRNKDILSIGYAVPFFSKGLVSKKGYCQSESDLEINYNIVGERFNIQPCIQFLNDIAGERKKNCTVYMIRFTFHRGNLI